MRGLSHESAEPFVLTNQSTIGYGGHSWGDSRLGTEANVAEAPPKTVACEQWEDL